MSVFSFGAHDLAEDVNTYIRNDHPRASSLRTGENTRGKFSENWRK